MPRGPLRGYAGLVRWAFADPVRPIELALMLAAGGWGLFALAHPALFDMPTFSGLRDWRDFWAGAALVSAGVQAICLVSRSPVLNALRFAAGAVMFGLWTGLSASFAIGSAPSMGISTYGALALLAFLGASWLSLTRWR